MVVSAIFYMGNKRKLIDQLEPLFPKDINTFYDLFSGSAVVSMNVKAKDYVLNDIDTNLVSLYGMFHSVPEDKIIMKIEENIRYFNLPTKRTKENKELREQYKKGYYKLRDFYNKYRFILDLYTLTFFSFSQGFRFNHKNEFNLAMGNDCYSEKNKQYIKNTSAFFKQKNVYFYNQDFSFIQKCELKENDFIYLDPPYFGTTAHYNESSRPNSWNEEKNNQLLDLLLELNENGVKWGMSNIFKNKNFVNEKLIKWCEENNFKVYHLNKKYNCLGTKGINTDEVYICNY